jgi:NhaP-type Na+/H+ and K+/H+ antiporter
LESLNGIIIVVSLLMLLSVVATRYLTKFGVPILMLFKMPVKDQMFISFVGFRGAASIVFATYPLTSGLSYSKDIFDIVFFIAMSSLIIQGLALKPVSRALKIKGEEGCLEMKDASRAGIDNP